MITDPTIPTKNEKFTALHLAARCTTDLYSDAESVPDVPPSGNILYYLTALQRVDVSATLFKCACCL